MLDPCACSSCCPCASSAAREFPATLQGPRCRFAFTDGKLFFSKAYPELFLSQPEVFASSTEQLVVKLHLAGPISAGGLRATLDGDLFFAGHPVVVDNELRLPDLEPTVETNSFLLGLKAALDAKSLKDQARAALTLDLGERFAAVRQKFSKDVAFDGSSCLRSNVARVAIRPGHPDPGLVQKTTSQAVRPCARRLLTPRVPVTGKSAPSTRGRAGAAVTSQDGGSRPATIATFSSLMPSTLVIVRHGQSTWNEKNLFTGWVDVDLTEQGVAEAKHAGTLLKAAGVSFDVSHTSVLSRAVRTANLALEVSGQPWLPVSRSWRLNERHYGDLQGKDKVEMVQQFGKDQVHLWRRSYDVPPPPVKPGHPFHPSSDPRYARLAPDALPSAECLKDVVARVLPYWHDTVVPQLRANLNVLIVAHGNSLRALIKHLEGLSDADIVELNVPTGMPRLYRFNDDLSFAEPARYLDEAAAKAGAAAVARQTG